MLHPLFLLLFLACLTAGARACGPGTFLAGGSDPLFWTNETASRFDETPVGAHEKLALVQDVLAAMERGATHEFVSRRVWADFSIGMRAPHVVDHPAHPAPNPSLVALCWCAEHLTTEQRWKSTASE